MCRCSNRTMWFMVLSSVNQFDLFWDWWAKIDQGNYCLGLYIVDVWEKISLIIWTSGVTIAVFVACRVLLSVRAATLVVRKGSWLINMRSLSLGLSPGPFWDLRLVKRSPGVRVMNHDRQGGEWFKRRVGLSVDACSSRILRRGMVYVYSTTFRTGRSKPKALTNLCVSWI